MRAIGIEPDVAQYSKVMLAFAKKKEIEQVEKLFQEVKKNGLTLNPILYNSLIVAYAKANRALEAEKIMDEMREEGLKPDVITYTSVIDAYKRVKNYEKCWELYEEYFIKDFIGKDVDEFLTSYMIRLCAATHESEKAIRLFADLESKGFVEHAKPYNSIIFALGSRKDYAHEAIRSYQKMIQNKVVPDNHTIVGVLKATSKIGDLETASIALKQARLYNLKIDQHIYNGLIKTYAAAIEIE